MEQCDKNRRRAQKNTESLMQQKCVRAAANGTTPKCLAAPTSISCVPGDGASKQRTCAAREYRGKPRNQEGVAIWRTA